MGALAILPGRFDTSDDASLVTHSLGIHCQEVCLSLPLIRLAIGPMNGTAHYGALLGTEPVTACAARSPDLAPIVEHTAHSMCQKYVRAWLILTTPRHLGGEPDLRPAVGKGAAAHRPIPGHLMGYCGKPLDTRHASTRRECADCPRLGQALERLQRRAGELVLPPSEPCHPENILLWAPLGRGNLVTGHVRHSVTGIGYCGQPLSVPNPGASHECAACRRHRHEAEHVRRTHTVPRMRQRARWWLQWASWRCSTTAPPISGLGMPTVFRGVRKSTMSSR